MLWLRPGLQLRIVVKGSCLAVLSSVFLLLVAPRAGAQLVLEDPNTFQVKQVWNAGAPAFGVPFALSALRFSPEGDILYVFGGAEFGRNPALYAVDVTRDPQTNEVTDLGPSDEISRFSICTPTKCQGTGSGFDSGPEGNVFYIRWANILGQRAGNVEGEEWLSDLSRVGVPRPAGPFALSADGLTFSPHIVDPNTDFGLMQVSVSCGPRGRCPFNFPRPVEFRTIYNVPLTPREGGFFEPQSAQPFVTLPISGGGGIHYIPSGPDEGNLMYTEYTEAFFKTINIVSIDRVTGFPIDHEVGLPVLGTEFPRVERFARVGKFPVGLEFDPLTNDLFVSTVNSLIRVTGFPPPAEKKFQRGDANADGRADLSDAVFVLNYLFTGGPAPGCLKSADCDDTGVLDLTDGVYLLSLLFLGGAQLPEPFPGCGRDPTQDELTCELTRSPLPLR